MLFIFGLIYILCIYVSSCFASDKEERKSQVITALLKLGLAQADVLLNDWNLGSCAVTEDDLDTTMLDLAKWIDITDSKVPNL